MACNSYCNGCVYKGIVQGHVPCCNYIFMEDKRRPCPPGEGCAVKTTNREARRKTAEERKRKKLEQAKEARAKKRLARVHTVICPICERHLRRTGYRPGTAQKDAPKWHIRRRCRPMSKSGGKHKRGNIGKGGW